MDDATATLGATLGVHRDRVGPEDLKPAGHVPQPRQHRSHRYQNFSSTLPTAGAGEILERMMDPLLEEVLEAHGSLDLWSGLTKITARVSIGGPIWAIKGWPDALVQETVEIDTKVERSVFTPFTRPDLRSVFEVGPERVTLETLDGEQVEQQTDARAAFKGYLRSTPWDVLNLGYFVGYAFWNYLTTPFVFTYPGVVACEIEPWRESGQTWRRLHVTFPESIATHNPEQVFYFDHKGLQRRMDYVTEVLGSTLVGHYTTHHQVFGGLVIPTRRRVFRRNPDGTVNLNMPSITIDVQDFSAE